MTANGLGPDMAATMFGARKSDQLASEIASETSSSAEATQAKSARECVDHRLAFRAANVVSFEAAWYELNNRQPTPEVTVEAIKHAVRTRGIAALNEPATRERISRCDEDALDALDNWLDSFKRKGERCEREKPRS